MPPGPGFPIPPFQWPHVGRQWPLYNVESDQADGLVMWMPYGGGYPGLHQHVDLVGGLTFAEGGTPTWVFDNERGWVMLFDDASTEYLEIDQAVVSGPPFSATAWIRSDSIAHAQAVIFIGDKDVGTQFHCLYLAGNAGGDPVRAYTYAGGAAVANTTAGYTANTWHHVAGVWATAADRRVYIDCGSKGTDTTSKSPTGLDRTSIGRFGDSTPVYYMSGRIADARIYDRALTDTEIWQIYDPATRWELYRPPQRLWRLGAIAPPTAALPLFSSPDAIHSLVFGGVTVR